MVVQTWVNHGSRALANFSIVSWLAFSMDSRIVEKGTVKDHEPISMVIGVALLKNDEKEFRTTENKEDNSSEHQSKNSMMVFLSENLDNMGGQTEKAPKLRLMGGGGAGAQPC